MKGKMLIMFLLGILCGQNGFAASDNDSNEVKIENPWSVKKSVGLFFNQAAYSNYWKGGGVNSIALSSRYELLANFKKNNSNWENRIEFQYGVIKIGSNEIQKNEDNFEVNSKYGYKFSKHLRLTGLLSFQTRLHDQYALKKNGEKGKRIGNFLSPALLNVGSGLDYFTNNKVLSVYYTPVNSKITYVHDGTVRKQYLPKEPEGAKAKYELGSLVRVEVKKEIWTNVFLHSISTFFTNHLKNFGNIDVNIENRLKFKVNKFLSANFLTQLVYDEDTRFDILDEEGEPTGKKGPRTQFKEVFNIGFSHSF